MSVTPSPDPVVLVDVDDLAEADLDADLADRLEADGRVSRRPGAAGAPADDVQRPGAGTGPWPGLADAVSLAWAIRRDGATAAAVHDLGHRAATLAD
jgi:hypothetical protein